MLETPPVSKRGAKPATVVPSSEARDVLEVAVAFLTLGTGFSYLARLGVSSVLGEVAGAVAVGAAAIGWTIVFLGVLTYRVRRARKQLALNEEAAGIVERGNFCLYLRPFATAGKLKVLNPVDDPVERWLLGRSWDLEFAFCYAFTDVMDFIAIGHNGQSIGAAKVSVSDALWEDRMHELARQARLIIIVPLPSPSTLEEVAYIDARPELLKKTIFVMPPNDRSLLGFAGWEPIWNEARLILEERGIGLPCYTEDGGLYLMGESSVLRFSFNFLAPAYIAAFCTLIAKAAEQAHDPQHMIVTANLLYHAWRSERAREDMAA